MSSDNKDGGWSDAAARQGMPRVHSVPWKQGGDEEGNLARVSGEQGPRPLDPALQPPENGFLFM